MVDATVSGWLAWSKQPALLCASQYTAHTYRTLVNSEYLQVLNSSSFSSPLIFSFHPAAYRSDLSRAKSGIGYFSWVLVQSDTFQMSSLKMSQDYRLVTWLGISLK